jgi:MoxR-like ATPase
MSVEVNLTREERYRELSAFVDAIKAELGRVVIGQSYMVERLLIGLLTGGHVLLEGVPGLAKTLTVKSLSECLDLQFSRIQFTPDLLPADLIGTMIFDPQSRDFIARRGPVFTNILLADEINRAPAKVQSALLECMQERQVTLGDSTTALPRPFLVLATQNPIEQEGTYPLPEAQIDRFMLMIRVGYPSRAEERRIMDLATETTTPARLTSAATAAQILAAQQAVREVSMTNGLKDYIVDIICATRNPAEYGIKSIQDYIEFGASPRATIYLNLAAKAHAFLRGSEAVFPDDIKAVAYDVLRHRVIPTYEAEADGMTPEKIIEKILETIKVP